MTGFVAKPRLLLFSHICSPNYFTGAEKLLLSFVKEMTHSFECVLIVPREGAIARAARLHGIPVDTLDVPLSIAMYVALPHLGNELNELIRSEAWVPLVELLLRHRPAYVWTNTCVHPLPAIAAKALGIPVIWALMETINPNSHRGQAASVVDAYSDRIVGISHTVLEPIPAETRAAKAFVLSPLLNRDELLPGTWAANRYRQRRSHGWGEQHRVAGYIASTIYPNKGLQEFLEAMLPIAAADPRVRMLIVGNSADDGYFGACRAMVRRARLEDRVAWVPFAERIEAVYPAMDVVVVPSLLAEGFGMAALEGMMFGKPVVSFASGGLAEIHEAVGGADFLVQPGDVGGLTARAAALLGSDALRLEVGRRNEQEASRLFGVEAFRSRLAAFVARLPPPSDGRLLHSGLVRGSGTAVYWIEHAKRRPFPSDDHFLRLGFRFADVVRLPDERLLPMPLGDPMLAGEAPAGNPGLPRQTPADPPAPPAPPAGGALPRRGRGGARKGRSRRSGRTRARLSNRRKIKARGRSRSKARAGSRARSRPARPARRAGSRRSRAGAKRHRR